MKLSFLLLLMLSGVGLSACAIPQQVDNIEREQRRLRSENASLKDDLNSARSSLADTRANLQQVQQGLNALKARVDEVQYQTSRQVGKSTREGDQKTKELESRIAKVEGELKEQAALLKSRDEELQSLKTAQGSKEAGSAVAKESGGEQLPGEPEPVRRDYEQALKLLDNKDYKGAITRFRGFLKKYPDSAYANKAQYWIGEAYYALRQFDQAILEFDTVRRKYPKGDKVPAALLKMGFAFAELGDKVDARLILQELVDRYPQTEESGKAKQKLKTLES